MLKTTNDLDTKALYDSNKEFEQLYNTDKNNYYDFTIEDHRYYGVCDLDKNILIPKQNKIKYESRFKIQAFDFVIDQYIDLAARYAFLQQSNGYINSDKEILNCIISPYNVFQSPQTLFNNKFTVLKENYNKTHVANKLHYSNVDDFYSFLAVFNSDLFKTATTQKTLSEVILANSYGGVNTGLGIALKKPNFSNDQEKIDFYNNQNFSFFRLMAEEYGFYIDSSNPYMLISNIDSKNTKKYLLARYPNGNIQTNSEILKEYYDIALNQDYELYKQYILSEYQQFIQIHGYTIKFDKCGEQVVQYLQPITLQQIDDKKLLLNYFVFKNVNLNKYDAFQIQKHLEEIKKLAALDTHKALVYIYNTIHLWRINEQLIKKPSQKI